MQQNCTRKIGDASGVSFAVGQRGFSLLVALWSTQQLIVVL
jgi:hypothetical protein